MGLFSSIGRRKRSLIDSGLLNGLTDRHSHILPGVDDGVRTVEESLEVLAYMESLGIKELWCTPHVMDDLQTPTETLKDRFHTLKEAYEGPITLHLAAEYMLDTEFETRLEEDDLLIMGDDMVLVETSTNTPPYNLPDMLERTMKKGYRPVLAHPERYRYMEMTDYRHFREMGIFFQLNLGSLTGYYGEGAQKKSRMLLSEGWYSAVGSDCHRLSSIERQYNEATLPMDVVDSLKKMLATSAFK